MDAVFDPKKQLEKLLGPTPTHPWAALIPQVLLWSFRRFCVEKLTLSEGGLEESLCDDLLELVHMYCAKGLEVVSIDWFTPDNIEEVSSPLGDYMRFFIEFSRELDRSLEEEDDKEQDILSEFLDESMGKTIAQWLHPAQMNLLIFPVDVDDDDEFSEAQFTRLINALLMYSYKSAEPAPKEEKEEQQQQQEEQQDEQQNPEPVKPRISLLWYVLAKSKGVNPAPDVEEIVVPPAPVDEAPEPVIDTIAKAFAHRRTRYKYGRKSQQPRVKTRKTHPALY
jgi:hypothetical protein